MKTPLLGSMTFIVRGATPEDVGLYPICVCYIFCPIIKYISYLPFDVFLSFLLFASRVFRLPYLIPSLYLCIEVDISIRPRRSLRQNVRMCIILVLNK